MRIRSNLKGTKGFVTAYNRLIRFQYMISERAKERVKILASWERHGTEATTEAFSISKRTLQRWQSALKAKAGQLEALNTKSTAPNRRRSRQVDDWVENSIITLRTKYPRIGKAKLHTLLTQDGYIGSVSTIGRILNNLKQRGLLPNPKPLSFYAKSGIHREKIKQHKKKLRRPQSVRVLELDTVVRFIDGTKRYILTAVDTKTRTVFAGIYTNHGSQSTSDFLKHCLQVLPDCPTHIQTDNGSEFAKYFHETVTKLNLTHYHTYHRNPKMNTHIERFNRTLQEWIIYNRSLLRDNVAKANLIEYLLWYNTKRPHHALGLKSPFQCMIEGLTVVERQRWWTSTRSCFFMWICYSFATMVIRMRHTRSHTANRRSHHALKAPNLAVCKNCGSQHRPHHMCLDCGFYNGRMVLDLAAKKKDREARMSAKREARKGQESNEEAPAQTPATV